LGGRERRPAVHVTFAGWMTNCASPRGPAPEGPVGLEEARALFCLQDRYFS
jgi:hypothetical protein